MAVAPKVRQLNQIIAEQRKGIVPQLGLIDQNIQANAQAGAAQEAGLAAKQQQAFGEIEQTAQNKGMFFSGFTPDEQARYTSTTYLPALAELQATIASTRSNLLGKKADLEADVFKTATNIRENDRSVLADWKRMTAEQKFNASQAQKQRVFEAEQNEKNRQFEAAQNAANRSASASSSAPDAPVPIKTAVLQAFGSAGNAPGLAEQMIPAIMAEYGVNKNQAATIIYQTRKDLYGS